MRNHEYSIFILWLSNLDLDVGPYVKLELVKFLFWLKQITLFSRDEEFQHQPGDYNHNVYYADYFYYVVELKNVFALFFQDSPYKSCRAEFYTFTYSITIDFRGTTL